jgi:hypothetical protein
MNGCRAQNAMKISQEGKRDLIQKKDSKYFLTFHP